MRSLRLRLHTFPTLSLPKASYHGSQMTVLVEQTNKEGTVRGPVNNFEIRPKKSVSPQDTRLNIRFEHLQNYMSLFPRQPTLSKFLCPLHWLLS